jgi:cytochrome c oxidase subunit 2
MDVEACSSPDGRKEINELHVPVNRNVRLVMASEDVIHDFSVPAFRVKMDVVPGHYNTMWFRPTKSGRYHFFCSQYCGTNHAVMGGWVTVMEQTNTLNGFRAPVLRAIR